MLALCILLATGGPLGLRTQGPLRELFLDVTALDARPLQRLELDARWTLANTWNEPMVLQRGDSRAVQELDEQADSLSLRVRAPWLGNGWTALEWKLTRHWGGYSDGAIEVWHSLIGAFNYQRSHYPRDQVRLIFADDAATAFDVRSGTWAPGDATLRSGYTWYQTASLALAARFDLKLPVGSLSAAGGSGGWDAGAGMQAAWAPLPGLTLHGLLALSRLSALSAPTLLQPKPWHLTAEASLELALGARWTLLLEDRVVSPLLQPGWALLPGSSDDALLSTGLYAGFRAHNQVSAGARRGPFSVWLSEDFTPGPNPHSVLHFVWVSNAPDIVLGAAFTAQFE